jgi:hypothetical protein
MEPKTVNEKLQVLLPHWIDHNRSHVAEFKEWIASARSEKADGAAELLERAAANMAANDEILKKALSLVGGPGEIRENHHHRDKDHSDGDEHHGHIHHQHGPHHHGK